MLTYRTSAVQARVGHAERPAREADLISVDSMLLSIGGYPSVVQIRTAFAQKLIVCSSAARRFIKSAKRNSCL